MAAVEAIEAILKEVPPLTVKTEVKDEEPDPVNHNCSQQSSGRTGRNKPLTIEEFDLEKVLNETDCLTACQGQLFRT